MRRTTIVSVEVSSSHLPSQLNKLVPVVAYVIGITRATTATCIMTCICCLRPCHTTVTSQVSPS
jgi:hypothetical protein